MADVKVKALIGIGRFLLACAVGYAIWYFWYQFRPEDEWFISVLAGAISTLFTFVMLIKLKGGGD